MRTKIIKDPLYGYIEIDDFLIPIIDSPFFQRLRYIIQTSYSSLYPSSVHNRFTHSLGVYYLGKMAVSSLFNNSPEISNIDENQCRTIKNMFLLACLCHDIGHSPFSHTGEVFYDKFAYYKELKERVSDQNYSEEAGDDPIGKEHEILSALLVIKEFDHFISEGFKDFVVRCILGIKYKNNNEDQTLLCKNACIELLNSDIIDVDKLDYIIRDSYMSGYDSVRIDFRRLLGGISICSNSNFGPICFNKHSLSVLENVLNAHDLERRWVQSNPTICYETFLVNNIIKDINYEYKGALDTIFCYDALTVKGIKLVNNMPIKLLTDNDILYFSKCMYDNSTFVQQFYSRELRKKPLWKSEADYKALFEMINLKERSKLYNVLCDLSSMLMSNKRSTIMPKIQSINDDFIKNLKKAIVEMKREYKIQQGSLNRTTSSEKTMKEKLEKEELKLDICSFLQKEFKEKNWNFDFVVLSTKEFRHNISKSSFKKLPIKIDAMNGKIVEMENISPNLFSMNEGSINNYFYFYFEKTNNIDVVEFCKIISNLAIQKG